MAKIKLDFRDTPEDLLAYGQQVIDDTTGNANFTSINALLTTFTTGHYDYGILVGAVVAADQALKTAILARDAGQPVFEQKFSNLAMGAEGAVLGDATKLSGGGWQLQADRQSPQPLGQVVNLSVTTGDDIGELDAHWNRLKNASSFEVQMTLTPENPASWQPLHNPTPTKSKTTFTGLTSGQRIFIRVRGVGGSTGYGPWSDPAAGMVP